VISTHASLLGLCTHAHMYVRMYTSRNVFNLPSIFINILFFLLELLGSFQIVCIILIFCMGGLKIVA
jgi:hypothetical protein